MILLLDSPTRVQTFLLSEWRKGEAIYTADQLCQDHLSATSDKFGPILSDE